MKPVVANAPPKSRFWRPLGLGGIELALTSCKRFSFPKHFHDEYVVAVMMRGVERLRHQKGNDLAPEGSLILINPGQVHENGSVNDAGFSYRTLYVPVPVVERILSDAGVRTATMPEFARAVVFDRELADLVRQFHDAIEAGEPVLRLQSLLMVSLSVLFRRYAELGLAGRLPHVSGRAIALVKEYLDAHALQKVSLDDLARVAGASPYHLARSFREAVGLPPCQYLIQRRLLHAMARLRQGVPISMAAIEAGFTDQSHLTRHFKRVWGVTPGQFQGSRKNVQDGLHR